MEQAILYHLTRVENVSSIKKNGLQPSHDGYVYLFDDDIVDDGVDNPIDVSDCIARHQCCILDEYAMFRVYVPTDLLEADNVGDLTSPFQYRVKGGIDKQNLEYLGVRSVDEDFNENYIQTINHLYNCPLDSLQQLRPAE